MSASDSVSASYDVIADAWQRSRAAGAFRERLLIERLVSPLSPKARVLDLGCGGGEPISRFLSKAGFGVVGVDASPRLLDYASRAVPRATFVVGDMRTVDLGSGFDAIVAWDSIFHLSRSDHPALFVRLWNWLRAGGRLLISLGGSDEADFTSEMYGRTFYYSGHDPSTALALLSAAGFRIEHWEVDDPSSRGHIAIIAVRDVT